jgi:hypothetical protein
MLHFPPDHHFGGSRPSVASFTDQRGHSPGARGGGATLSGFNRPNQRTVIYLGTQALTSDQIQAAKELYTEHSSSSVDAATVHELLVSMNMLPPPGFLVPDALESIGQPLDRVSLDGFLAVVNGVWKAAEDLTSHDMVVRHAYEAFAQARDRKKHRSDNSGTADTSTDDDDDAPVNAKGAFKSSSVHGGAPYHSDGSVQPTSTSPKHTSKASDPVLHIVKSNMNRGLRNLQQFLSPSQGEPEMLRSFINLGAVDSGAGFMLDMTRMSQKCADVGITTKDMSVITKIFDPTNSGELDYDEYLQLMRSDLEKLGLKSTLLTQLRRVLFQKPSAAPTTSAAALSAALATSMVSVASPASPAAAAAGVTGAPLTVLAITSAFQQSSPLRHRLSGQRLSAAPHFPSSDAFGDAPHRASGASADNSKGADDDLDNDDPFSGDLGKSFFHSIAARQASIHEFSNNGPHRLVPLQPMEFFNEMHDNLEHCRVELEGLREYEIEAQNLKLYGTRRPRGSQRYQAEAKNLGATKSGVASPRKQSLNATGASVTSSTMGHMTKTHSAGQLAVAAQASSEMTSGTVLPQISSARRESGGSSTSEPQQGRQKQRHQHADVQGYSSRRYGAGHNPAIPRYQYGVPPLPLLHWSPRSGRLSNHNPAGNSCQPDGDRTAAAAPDYNATPTEQAVSRVSSEASDHHGTQLRTPRTQSQLVQQQQGSTLLESYYSFKQLLSPQVTPRSQVVAACGYAPTPVQVLSGRRHPVPPPRASNRTPDVLVPTQLKSPKHAVVRQTSPTLIASGMAERGTTTPTDRDELVVNHVGIKQSIYRLAGMDAAIEALVSPLSPLSPHQQTEISGPQSPRNYPESPQHRGRRTVSSAAIRALARASSMNGTINSSLGGTSPRHTRGGSRSSSKKKLIRTPSMNRMLVAAALSDEDMITDVDAAPAAIGGMMDREDTIKAALFEKDLVAGNPRVLGRVSARMLKDQEHTVQAVYGHHVPRTTAQALLPKPPPRQNDPTAASAQLPPLRPKDSAEGQESPSSVI